MVLDLLRHHHHDKGQRVTERDIEKQRETSGIHRVEVSLPHIHKTYSTQIFSKGHSLPVFPPRGKPVHIIKLTKGLPLSLCSPRPSRGTRDSLLTSAPFFKFKNKFSFLVSAVEKNGVDIRYFLEPYFFSRKLYGTHGY